MPMQHILLFGMTRIRVCAGASAIVSAASNYTADTPFHRTFYYRLYIKIVNYLILGFDAFVSEFTLCGSI